MEIECSFFDSSKLAIDKKKTSSDRLIELVKKLNGRNYLSGNGGKNYQNINNLKISSTKKNSRLFIAYYLNNVRLIDNL